MNEKNRAAIGVLGRIGVSISEGSTGWGWRMENAKIVRDWEGSYPTAVAAADAALAWLLEHARKGLLCHHLHATADQDAELPVERASFDHEPWYTRN